MHGHCVANVPVGSNFFFKGQSIPFSPPYPLTVYYTSRSSRTPLPVTSSASSLQACFPS